MSIIYDHQSFWNNITFKLKELIMLTKAIDPGYKFGKCNAKQEKKESSESSHTAVFAHTKPHFFCPLRAKTIMTFYKSFVGCIQDTA